MANLIFPKLIFNGLVKELLNETTGAMRHGSSSSTGSTRSIKDILLQRRNLTEWLTDQRNSHQRNQKALSKSGATTSAVHVSKGPDMHGLKKDELLLHSADVSMVGRTSSGGSKTHTGGGVRFCGRVTMVHDDGNVAIVKMKENLLSGSSRIYLSDGTKIKCTQSKSGTQLTGTGYVRTAKGYTVKGDFRNGVFTEHAKQAKGVALALAHAATLLNPQNNDDVDSSTQGAVGGASPKDSRKKPIESSLGALSLSDPTDPHKARTLKVALKEFRLGTAEGKRWLTSTDGKVWLASTDGKVWLASTGGSAWLLNDYHGNVWLNSTSGRIWLNSTDGKRWLNSKDGKVWLSSTDGKIWLNSKDGGYWLASTDGKVWLASTGGKIWLSSTDGGYWLSSTDGRNWLNSPVGKDWLSSTDGEDWLDSKNGTDWLQSTDGQRWLATSGKSWLSPRNRKLWFAEQDQKSKK